MILQTLEGGSQARVVSMVEHLSTAAQLLAAIDEHLIELPEPRDQFAHVVANHDAGWLPENGQLELNPKSGWPFHVFDTPDLVAGRIYTLSVEANGRHHPYCGVLTSMHVQGFYNGRYGESAPNPARGPGEAGMLERIASLEVAWRARLAADPVTASWVEERKLRRAYRLLQLFDRLALYLNRGAPESGEPKPISVPSVPSIGVGAELELSCCWSSPDRLAVHPFAFAQPEVEIHFSRRLLAKGPQSSAELQAMFHASDTLECRVILSDGAP